jgi:thioredoxin-related protein
MPAWRQALPSFLPSLLLAAAPLPAQQREWLQDFTAAQALAREQGKDLLLQFTGSDWCTWCIKLHADVFAKDEFVTEAGKHYVFVELDYPRATDTQPPAIAEQNAKLQERFAPGGFPHVFVTDAQGRPYGSIGGYQKGGPQPYLARLAELRQVKAERDRLLAEAGTLAGAARAARLRQALAVLQPQAAALHDDVAASIRELETTAAGELTSRQRAEGYLQDHAQGRFAELALERAAYLRHWAALTEAERGEVEKALSWREFNEALAAIDFQQGGGASLPAPAAPRFQEAVLRLLAYRHAQGRWPTGAAGNRALIAVAAWADHRRDTVLFAKCIDELRTVRLGLGGNEQFLAWFEQRLAALRTGEVEGEFLAAFFDRNR